MGNSTSRNRSTPLTAASKDRGKVKNIEEARDLTRKNKFTELSKEGKEAFFRYLRGDRYPEDEDICDIDPDGDGMNIKSRQYQFWVQCEHLERFTELFKVYVTDDDKRLPEVQECFNENKSNEENLENFLSKKRTDAESTKRFIDDLKDKMQNKLDTDFEQFKKALNKQFKEKT